MMPTRIRLAISHGIAGIFAIAIFGPLFYLFIDRDPPYVRISGTINPKNARPGDEVAVAWIIRTNRQCDPASNLNVSRQVTDSKGTVWDLVPVPSIFGRDLRDENTSTTIVRNFTLPLAIAPGPARYRSTAFFSCNFTQYFWPIKIDKPDFMFMISPPTQREGQQGVDGPQGVQGNQGVRGQTGQQGVPGERGPQGEAGPR